MDLLDAIAAAVEPMDARIGVTGCEPFTHARTEMDRRDATGERGSLGFVYRDTAIATTPLRSFPWARSMVVAAVPYLAEGDGVGADGDAGRTVARFADGDRYAAVEDVTAAIAGALGARGWRAEPVFDDDRLVDRAAAVRAGIAWEGKSTMALHPEFGPWFLIGTVLTDAALDTSEPMTRSCGTCTACIPACPTGAIVAPGVLDARRCLAAAFQSRGALAPDLRSAAGSRIYGCDACLTACPPGDKVISRLSDGVTIDPRAVLAMADDDIDERFGHWYIPGRKARFVRRNALVAVGNTATSADIGLLAGYLGHPDALLRGHAAWALGRIDEPSVVLALRAASSSEPDSWVQGEIEAAIDR